MTYKINRLRMLTVEVTTEHFPRCRARPDARRTELHKELDDEDAQCYTVYSDGCVVYRCEEQRSRSEVRGV